MCKLILNVIISNALLIYSLYLTHWLEFLPSCHSSMFDPVTLTVKYKIIANYQYIDNQLPKTGLQPNPETLCILKIPHTMEKVQNVCIIKEYVY